MSCEKKQISRSVGDCLEIGAENRPFDASATDWLVGQGVHYLNTADKEGELAYQRVVEQLRHDSKDVLKTVVVLFNQANSGDAPLRWSLLYVLGDAGDDSSGDFLVHTALRQLPEAKEGEGCEGPRDTEMLVCTMAVHAIQSVSKRHPQVSELLLKIVSEKPARPILIEAVKVAGELGLQEKVREILPKEDHWILDIRRARTEELFAEPEREDGKERGFTPPKTGAQYTTPHVECCCSRKER
jgi:hypothetical protein